MEAALPVVGYEQLLQCPADEHAPLGGWLTLLVTVRFVCHLPIQAWSPWLTGEGMGSGARADVSSVGTGRFLSL